MLTAEMVETIKMWVEDWVQVKPKENIVITSDDKTNPMVLEAVSRLVRDKGAKVTLCKVEEPPLAEGALEGSHVGERFIRVAEPFIEARKAADKVINLGGIPDHNPQTTTLDYEYRARRYSLSRGASKPEFLTTPGAKFPRELLFRIAQRFLEIVRKGTSFRLTHPLGTDLTFEGLPGNWGGPTAGIPASGWGKYRLGRCTVGCNPPETANGVVVSPFCKDVGGILPGPMRLTFVDGWCEKVEGGKEAEAFRRLMGDDRNNRRIQEIMQGLNPKISAYNEKGELTYDGTSGAGKVHMAIGREVGMFASSQHLTLAYIPGISFYVEDKILVDKGRLKILEDPKIRKLAEKYGDPDELLSQPDAK